MSIFGDLGERAVVSPWEQQSRVSAELQFSRKIGREERRGALGRLRELFCVANVLQDFICILNAHLKRSYVTKDALFEYNGHTLLIIWLNCLAKALVHTIILNHC